LVLLRVFKKKIRYPTLRTSRDNFFFFENSQLLSLLILRSETVGIWSRRVTLSSGKVSKKFSIV